MVVSEVVEKLVVHRRMKWPWWHDGCWAGRKRAIFTSAAFLSHPTANQRRS